MESKAAQRVCDEHGKKLARNRIYSACAWLIIIGVVLALAQNFWPDWVKAETRRFRGPAGDG